MADTTKPGATDAAKAGATDAANAGMTDAANAGATDAANAGMTDAANAGATDAANAGMTDAANAGVTGAANAGVTGAGRTGTPAGGGAAGSEIAARRSPGARRAMAGFVAAMLVVHGVVGWWAPLAGDDWRHLLDSSDAPERWLADHRSFAEALGHVLAHAPWLHAIVSPLAGVALIAGVFTLAARRPPDPGRWGDVLGVALVSCMIWIALPRAGVMWFHRPYAAAQIYGAALVVWLAVPYRCRWTLAGPHATSRLAALAAATAMLVLGLVAGTTTRQLAVAAGVGLAIAVLRTPRTKRRAWMWLGLAGVLAGAVAEVVRSPWHEAGRVVTRFEPNLVSLAPMLRAAGPLVTLISLLVLAVLLAQPRPSDAIREAPDAGDALAWLGSWIGLGVASLLGPRSTEATLLPATLALCLAALPILAWLARVRFARWTLVGLVVIVHALVWTRALATYATLDDEFRDRIAAIERTPAGQIATVAPYTQIVPDDWTIGEDWTEASLREALARERWDLLDIDLAPAFRQLEHNPDIALVLEVDHASDAQLAAAHPPARWAYDLPAARRQLTALVARLRAAAGPAVSARLRVTNVDFPARNARPIFAAWTDGAAIVAPQVTRSAPDATNHAAFSIPPTLAARLPETWAVTAGGAEPMPCTAGRCVAPLRAERTVIVACDAERCLVLNALVPRF